MSLAWDTAAPSYGGQVETLIHVLEPSSAPSPLSYYPHPAAHEGGLWVAHVLYDPRRARETLGLADLRTGRWRTVTETTGAVVDPACVVVAGGRLWLVWIEGPTFEVVACTYDPGQDQFGPRTPLSHPAHRCASLELRRNGTGASAVWEAWREDATNTIELARLAPDGQVVGAGSLTASGGVAYWPSAAHDGGRTWLTWCSPSAARDGYDAYVATFNDPFSKRAPATMARLNSGLSGNFQLYPKLTVDGDGEVWVSWLASTDTEYYDSTDLPGNSDFAYLQDSRSRRLRNVWWKTCSPAVARLRLDGTDTVVWSPGAPGGEPLRMLGHGHYPTLLAVDGGVPMLLFRRITPNLLFETVVSNWTGAGWSTPACVHQSGLQTGRNGPIRASLDVSTGTHAVALQVHRVTPEDSFRWKPPEDSTMAVVEIRAIGDPTVSAVDDGGTSRVLARTDMARIAPRATRGAFAAKRTFFGNIHVHSELSGCRRDTQQSLDLNYRWAKDLMGQDFHALTDHAEHLSDYDWRWTQTIASFYDFPGAFVAIPAYEWTVNDFGDQPHCGHCNVVLRAGVRHAFGSDEESTSTLIGLWRALPEGEAITIPHHTATFPYLRDWGLHDPRFERLVEVQQDRRGNYEYLGCPGEYGRSAPLQAREHNVEGGFVSDALARGYHLGLCAGGDHMGISMTGVSAPALTRAAVFDALFRRRCFGVTGAKIDLKLVAHTGRTSAKMGEVLVAGRSATLDIAVEVAGTAAIDTIDLVSGGKKIQGASGEGSERQVCAFSLAPSETAGYFYVRVVQTDGEMAWSSPIWLESPTTSNARAVGH